jgi:hypothetical protein
MRSAFEIFTVQYCNDPEFPEELKVFGDQYFWPSIASAEQSIHPISNACYKLQRDENTLADVVSYVLVNNSIVFTHETSYCALFTGTKKRTEKTFKRMKNF